MRLVREEDNTKLQLSDLCTINSDETRHRSDILLDGKQCILANKYTLTNEIDDAAGSEEFSTSCVDGVYAAHSPYWPLEATEWITRKR